MQRSKLLLIVMHSLTILVFAIIFIYSITRFTYNSYMGFSYDVAGVITFIPATTSGNELPINVGDRILKVGDQRWDTYIHNAARPFLPSFTIGDHVVIQVEHKNQTLTLPVVVQPRPANTIEKFSILILLPFAFWAAGVATDILIRPHDTRWLLMILFCYTTALWLSAGILSETRLFYSALVMRACLWLNLPISLHLHWVFPKPLKPVPLPLLIGIYGLGIVMAILQWLQVIPPDLLYVAFILSALGCIALLAQHIYSFPEHRRELKFLFLAAVIALLPSIAMALSGMFQFLPSYNVFSLVFLPIIPGAYFYTIYRRQLGGLELRANRHMSLVIYAMVIFVILGFCLFIASNHLNISLLPAFIVTFITCLVIVISILVFPNFQRWIETRILNMPLPPTKLLEIYTSRIVTSLEVESLVRLLQEEVFPSLLVRQAAILRLRQGEATPLLVMGVEPSQLPSAVEIPELLKQAGVPRLGITDKDLSEQIVPWARLILVSAIENQPVSLFLLGKRDPDDIYASSEISVFQSLANQTTLALINIDQAERLHNLYQSDIERSETEYTRLARILHDDVLNQLAVIKNSIEGEVPPAWEASYQAAADHIREVITELRPVMLVPYGLRAALVELVDQLNDNDKHRTKIQMTLSSGDIRYPPPVELHLFRIIQQACINAQKHSQAGTISLKGEFESGRASISVADNGVGFAAGERLDLSWLLANKHFGLAGMFERAAFIGAHLQVNSSDQQGTTIQVVWESSQ